MFEDKYNMTQEQNVFVVKRNLIDYIWKSAKLEGISVTYPQTDVIVSGISLQNFKVDDIITINNLKHGWQFILNNLYYPSNYTLLCEIHKTICSGLVYNAGYIRNVPISMGGTNWKPELPIEVDIKFTIENYLKEISKSVTERAIELMLYIMRTQAFLDGNKRTAMMLANHFMVSKGKGIISIPVEHKEEFKTLLIEFYETNDNSKVKEFVYNCCIDGINFK